MDLISPQLVFIRSHQNGLVPFCEGRFSPKLRAARGALSHPVTLLSRKVTPKIWIDESLLF